MLAVGDIRIEELPALRTLASQSIGGLRLQRRQRRAS